MNTRNSNTLTQFLMNNGFNFTSDEDGLKVYSKAHNNLSLIVTIKDTGVVEFIATDETENEDVIYCYSNYYDNNDFNDFMDFLKRHVNPTKRTYTLALTFDSYYDEKEIKEIGIDDLRDVIEENIYLDNLTMNLIQ